MRYKYVKQHEITDCGAACIATIAAHYGFYTNLTKIRELAGTDREGTSAYGIVQAAKQLGLDAKAVKGSQEAFFSDISLPCIAHVNMENGLQHYVVIYKISKKEIVIADPGEGIVKITPEKFFNGRYHWSGVLIFMLPTKDFKKGNEKENVFHKFLQLIIPQKRFMIIIFMASLLYTGLGIITAFYFKYLIDNLIPDNNKKLLTTISLAVIAINILRVLLSYLRSYLLLLLSQKLDTELLMGYYEHILKLPMNFFGSRKTGDVIARFNDASHVRDAISSAALSVVLDTVMAVAGGIILYLQNGKMFLICIAMVLLYILAAAVFEKKYRLFNRQQMEENANLTSYLVESVQGMQTIKSYQAEKESLHATNQKFDKLLKSIYKLVVTQNTQMSLKMLIELVGGVLILWIGALSVINHQMSIGALVAFESLMIYFLTPVQEIINLQPQMQTAVAAADRLAEILDLTPEVKENEKSKETRDIFFGDIKFEHVKFRYGTRNLVLDDVSFYIRKGQKVAFVGESGSGKTTLAKLILYLYQIEEGNIYLDEKSIDQITIESIRKKIAYISQETFLFSGSIKENLLVAKPDATIKEIEQAVKTAQAKDFIERLSMGYETQLVENGQNLSGGQRQRLSIARALLKNPDILILDEATSNLDTITEAAISTSIQTFFKDKTIIYIAHRLSSIRHCDQIFVMKKGKIVEHGSHEDLSVKEGLYTQLIHS